MANRRLYNNRNSRWFLYILILCSEGSYRRGTERRLSQREYISEYHSEARRKGRRRVRPRYVGQTYNLNERLDKYKSAAPQCNRRVLEEVRRNKDWPFEVVYIECYSEDALSNREKQFIDMHGGLALPEVVMNENAGGARGGAMSASTRKRMSSNRRTVPDDIVMRGMALINNGALSHEAAAEVGMEPHLLRAAIRIRLKDLPKKVRDEWRASSKRRRGNRSAEGLSNIAAALSAANSKCTEDDAYGMLELRNSGWTLKEIGKQYGVSAQTAQRYIRKYSAQ